MSLTDRYKEEEYDPEDFDTSSGCDMSFELSSDLTFGSPKLPRKLFGDEYDNNNSTPGPKTMPSFSPPYKRVRALRLFDSPLTPKTIIQKSSAATPLPEADCSETSPEP